MKCESKISSTQSLAEIWKNMKSTKNGCRYQVLRLWTLVVKTCVFFAKRCHLCILSYHWLFPVLSSRLDPKDRFFWGPVDDQNPAAVEVGSLSHYWQGFYTCQVVFAGFLPSTDITFTGMWFWSQKYPLSVLKKGAINSRKLTYPTKEENTHHLHKSAGC